MVFLLFYFFSNQLNSTQQRTRCETRRWPEEIYSGKIRTVPHGEQCDLMRSTVDPDLIGDRVTTNLDVKHTATRDIL